MNRLYHWKFVLHLHVLTFLLNLWVRWSKRTAPASGTRIAAFPYLPLDFPGGMLRIGHWEQFFKADHIDFQVYWPGHADAYLARFVKGSQKQRYAFLHYILRLRYRQFKQLNGVQAVWIQRAYLPFFPHKKPVFEKLLRKKGIALVVDFYDADYVHNPELCHGIAGLSVCTTVVSQHLKNYFEPYAPKTALIPLAIDPKPYASAHKKASDALIIGWTGNPGNALQLLKIETALQNIENRFPQIRFRFICREPIPLSLKKMEQGSWDQPDFDYMEWLASFDIGLVPYLDDNETTRAKVAMKSLEFMALGIPVVLSPLGISDRMEHENNCLLAEADGWEQALTRLIGSKELRNRLGRAGKKTLQQHHTYETIYPLLKTVLVNASQKGKKDPADHPDQSHADRP